MVTRKRHQRSLPRLSMLAASVLVAFGSLPAYALDPTALPTGGQVAAGSATINQSGARMDVNQATSKAIINWSSFNIGSSASVNFAQPSSSSVVLNRVTSSSGGSEILGRMTANGQVFLVNPSGVLFGRTAQVDVGGLVATSLNISDANFLAGRYVFASTGTAGSVTNEGTLRAAEGGYIALLAPEVRNDGVISARLGTVALAAGNKVTLDFAGDQLVSLAIDEAALSALVENRHVIQADGGTVILAARAAGDLAATVVNNSGLIQAASISERNGVIRLEGGERGVVAVSGTLDASGRGAGEHGGTIKVLGDRVGLSSGALLDASGDAGGGTVLIGGNYQGSGSEQQASATYVNAGAQIKADALTTGDGGRVIVWSNDYTEFNGAVSARGGAAAGNGGFVETSGKNVLQATGMVDASAPAGQAGNWLLDPNNITIQTAGSDTNVSGNPNFTTTNDSAIVTTSSIQTALNAGTSVTVTTGSAGTNLQAGNITVANAVAKTAGADATLTLNATNGITFNAGANVTSTTGQLNLTLNAGAGITTLQNVNTNGGVLTFNASGAMTQAGVISGTGSVVNQGTGTLTLTSANTYSGGTTIKAGTVNANVATALGTGAVTLGDSAGGSNAATLTSTSTGSVTYANAIVLASTTTGTLTVGRTAATGTKTFSGGVTGTNNLTVANNSTGAINFTGAVNNAGTITNSGTGTGAVTISAGVGSNVTTVRQNSTTSALTIQTAALNVNSGGTTLTNSSGTALLTVSGGVTGTGNLILDNDSGTASGVTLTTTSVNNTGTITNTGAGAGSATITTSVGANVTGVTQTSTTSALTLSGGVVLGAGGKTLINTSGGALLTASTVATSGTGNLVLDNDSTLTNGVTISAGVNHTGTVTNLGSGTGSVLVSGVIGANVTGVAQNSTTSTLNLSGNNLFTSGLTVLRGTVLGTTSAGAFGAAPGTITLGDSAGGSDAATLLFGTTGQTIARPIVLAANTTGTLTIGNANDIAALTFSGGVTGANDLTISNTSATAAARTIALTVGAVNNTGKVTNTGTSTGATTISTVGGVGANVTEIIENSTTSALTVSAPVTTTGSKTFRNASGGSLLTISGAVTGTGTVALDNDSTLANGITVSAGGINNTNTVTNLGSGTGSVLVSGVIGANVTGLTQNSTTSSLALSGANTYAGNTTISAGTLTLGAANVIPDGAGKGNVDVTGTLDLNGFGETINGLSGAGTVDSVAGGAPTLTVGGNNQTSTFSGVIQNSAGSLGLTKTGTGTLTLSGTNTYDGATSVSTGTLVAANANALGSTTGGTTVSAGATLNIDNVAIGSEAISISGNGVGGAGALTATGTGSLAGTLTLASASRIGTTSGASALALNGAVNVSGFALDITGAGDLTATNALNDFGTVTINSAGRVSLVDANALTIGASSVGTLIAQTLSGDLSLGGNVTATGTGDSILLAAAANFDNSGAFSLDPNTGGGGRWLVYSANPASDNRGGLVYGFKQYNATYGVTSVADATNNGFLYTVAPTITAGLAGTATKVYDGATTAPTASLTVSPLAGVIDGDTVLLSMTGATYDTRNVGGGKTVTANGISQGATNGLATVYGYEVSPTTASAAVGVITARPITVTADNQARPELTANPPFTASYSGFLGGDSAASLGGALVFATPANMGSPAGAYPITPSGVTSGNYTIAFIDGVLTVTAGTVTPPPAPPVSVSAFSALGGAIASTINPPGGAGVTAPSGAEFIETLAPIAGGMTAVGTVEHISPTISIINCGIRSQAEGCGPR